MPLYAILSLRWGAPSDEVNFKEMVEGIGIKEELQEDSIPQ
jgi:hypothetical protein